ncbi:MAG: hypothetical protein PHR56_03165 [Dehalococcoidales bacterium]|nr:hypothetical protein [Dehalococcoidales bacterium]
MRCHKYEFDITNSLKQTYCVNCEGCEFVTHIPKGAFEQVNPFELARLLLKKRKAELIPQLNDCPYCHKRALAYFTINDTFECMNHGCQYHTTISCNTPEYDSIIQYLGIELSGKEVNTNANDAKESSKSSLSDFLTGYFMHGHLDEQLSGGTGDLSNPMLLSVKMFLADIRSWRRQYKEGEYVCSDFAQEVYDAAISRGMRCGYTVIRFEKSEIGHAIVAFNTDYGLKFFEPQSGDEEDVIVGRRYSAQLKGVPEESIVVEIKISWNDGTSATID